MRGPAGMPPPPGTGASRIAGPTILGFACLAFILLVALEAVDAAGQVWFTGDDCWNIRWAIEHRDAPWRALTERHSVHDHVRPFTLMAVWLGAVVSGGAFWGPQAVLLAFLFLGLAGFVTLARQLTGDGLAGLLAGVLVALSPSFQVLPVWNAWMCTAGEVAFGAWALVAGKRALERDRFPWAALVAVAASGLFKEPGWLVYPAGILAMYWGRGLAAGSAERRVLATRAAALLLLGVAGFAYAWHPANVGRYSDASIATRLEVFLTELPRQVLHPWQGPERLAGPGLPALVVYYALFRALLPWRGAVLAACAIGGALLGAVHPAASGALLLGLPLAVLLRRWRDPPVGLVVLAASFGIMSVAPAFLPPHLLAGVGGLSVFVGAELAALFRGRPARIEWAVCGLALAVNAVRWAPQAWAQRQQPLSYDMRTSREVLFGGGALGRTLGIQVAKIGMEGLPENQRACVLAAPLGAMTIDSGSAPSAAYGTVLVAGVISLDASAALVDERLIAPSLLSDPKTRARAEAPEGLELRLGTGWYALGLRRESRRRDAQGTLKAQDACGKMWEVSASVGGAWPTVLTPVEVEAGCSPVVLHLTRTTSVLRPFLTRLRAPASGLWSVATVPRIVDVASRNGSIR